MVAEVEQLLAELADQPLPESARTRGGVEYAPQEMLWVFRDNISQISINFNRVPESCISLIQGLKKTLVWYLENRSPMTAHGLFSSFLAFTRQLATIRKGPIKSITAEDILTIKITSNYSEYNLAHTRPLLKKWCELRVQGVEPDAAYVLSNLKLRQHPTGIAVATLDPETGPLTDLEFEGIQSALNNAYANNEIGADKLLLCYLLMSLGARPTQIASLKCGDLTQPDFPDGDYILNLPRAKQRNTLSRSEFKSRRLIRQIGEPLTAYIESIKEQFSDIFNNLNEAPLFPQIKQDEYANSKNFEYHATSAALTLRVVRIFKKLLIPSERLGQNISISPIRFRRTFATRAAEEGWPLLVIAELLDHTSTKHVQVYAGLTSRIRAEFSRKIAIEMAPLAMAFAGRIIRSETDATRPGFASRIVDLRVDRRGLSMGSCGSYAHCGFARPIACYGGCYDFEPWLDGPHEAALDFMLARREHLKSTADSRIATINDRAILGCAQVILRCREILAENQDD